jgi:hypothetical protein
MAKLSLMSTIFNADTAHRTTRIWDITGVATSLILVPAPGDEIAWFGGFIAEACARGRPPFVMVIGNAAANPAAAHHDTPARGINSTRASRSACTALGLPADRLLFVGLQQPADIEPDDVLYNALKTAIDRIAWRYDCGILGVISPYQPTPGSAEIYRLAGDIADDAALGLFAAGSAEDARSLHPARSWRLHTAPSEALKHRALACIHRPTPTAGAELFFRL